MAARRPRKSRSLLRKRLKELKQLPCGPRWRTSPRLRKDQLRPWLGLLLHYLSLLKVHCPGRVHLEGRLPEARGRRAGRRPDGDRARAQAAPRGPAEGGRRERRGEVAPRARRRPQRKIVNNDGAQRHPAHLRRRKRLVFRPPACPCCCVHRRRLQESLVTTSLGRAPYYNYPVDGICKT